MNRTECAELMRVATHLPVRAAQALITGMPGCGILANPAPGPHSDFHDRSLSRGQKLSRRASEERVYKTLSDFSPRVLASQPWFLFPD
jgi:hypothetical protein